jgi:hypothetical protein
MKKVAISRIEIDLGGKTIKLTLQQAQSLKNALNDTFGEKVTQYVYPYHHHYPHPYTTWSSNAADISDTTTAGGPMNVTAYASSTGTLSLNVTP